MTRCNFQAPMGMKLDRRQGMRMETCLLGGLLNQHVIGRYFMNTGPETTWTGPGMPLDAIALQHVTQRKRRCV